MLSFPDKEDETGVHSIFYIPLCHVSVSPENAGRSHLIHKAFPLEHSDQGFHLLREVESVRRETRSPDSCGTCVLAVLCSAAPGGIFIETSFSFGGMCW